jgi:hypothetical protein
LALISSARAARGLPARVAQNCSLADDEGTIVSRVAANRSRAHVHDAPAKRSIAARRHRRGPVDR